MTRHPFPWVVLVAYAVLWFAPRINRWFHQRADRQTQMARVRWIDRRDVPTEHVTPTQVRVLRPGWDRAIEPPRDEP